MNTTDKAILVTGANHAVVQLLAEEALTGETKEGAEATGGSDEGPEDVAALPLDVIGAFWIVPFLSSRYGTS